MFAPSSGHLTSFDPDLLTHERPDTWELLEEDVANASCPDVYCANHRIDASDTSYEWAMARDIVRPRQGAGGGRVMRYVSTFSGIEAASVAWGPLGWEPIAFSEIEPFPCAVLAERFPNVPNLGDVTEIEWRRFARKHGKPDIVVGGSPCQSFSVAGGREGLDGPLGSCGSMFDAFVNSCLVGFFGRTSRERSRARMGRISDACSSPWMVSGTVWHGGYSTRSSSEWPSDAAVSSLSDALETRTVPARYSLSQTACAGILDRARRRGRPLPGPLQAALEARASATRSAEGPGA